MTLVSGPAYPLWFRIAILATLAWPFFAGFLFRRGADPRLFAIIPFTLNIAASSVGIHRVVRIASLTGPAPHATAAGLAEALIPLGFGAVVAATISFVLGVTNRWRKVSPSGFPRLLLTVNCVAFVGVFALAIYAREHSTYSATVDHASAAVALSLFAFFLLSLVATFASRGAAIQPNRWWFAAFGIAQLLAAAGIFVTVNSLRLFAMGAV